ncbi:uncharacterized protein EV420DRAFT_1125964 [Desarmillaria tabescens]|uniref:Uncharacterized protein n=1 Tax=Armillaria tabescens TaxID=1929756 RepID=A0AA39MN46_ARMTA|nr:uncharacterized protein EV420DRAFT_1125964 [Desarmillaria tabescens]KAK0440911.1 hypothetical protein EV420DRAFT_1125964 [Desarmillaria tabescens]
MVYCSGLWLSTFLYIFSVSFYKASMPTTDIIGTWEALSVLADILAYDVPHYTADLNGTLVLPVDTLVQGVVTSTIERIVIEPVVVVVESVESIDQGVITEAVEPIFIVKSSATVMIPEVSLAPASTVDSLPNQATVRARPTRSAPIVTQALSNLKIVMAFVQLAIIVMFAAVVVVLRRPFMSSKLPSIPILAPNCI